MGLLDFFTGKKQRKNAQKAADYQANKQEEMLQGQQDAADYAARQKGAIAAVNTGKVNLFDPTDEDAVNKFWAESGNINMADPFPKFLEESGKTILGDIERAAGMITDFGDRYAAGEEAAAELGEMQEGAQDAVGSIYSGELEDKFAGYNQDLVNLYEGLKGINQNLASTKEGAISSITDTGKDYAQSLYDAHMNKASLEADRYSAEGRLPDIYRQKLEELEGRYGDTERTQLEGAQRMGDARRSGALSDRMNYENAANRGLGGLFSRFTGQGGGSTMDAAKRMMQAEAAQGMAAPITEANAMQRELETAANVDASRKREGLLSSDADVLQSKVDADHYARLLEINPAMAEAYKNEALMKNQMFGYEQGQGMQSKLAEAENLGLDIDVMDDERQLASTLLNMQLGNQGQIANQAEMLKYISKLPMDLAMSESQGLADYAGPFTARGQISAPQTIFNTQPHTAPAPKQGPNMWEKALNLFKKYGGKD